MRRNFGLFFILLNLTLASHAVPLKRVSIAEFEQILAPMQGRQDDKVAKLVATL